MDSPSPNKNTGNAVPALVFQVESEERSFNSTSFMTGETEAICYSKTGTFDRKVLSLKVVIFS